MTLPVPILGLDHVVLRVADAERALKFYRDILGCRIERHRSELGLIQLRAGSSLIDLVLVDSELGRRGGGAVAAGGHNMDHFALRVDVADLARLRAGIVAQGVAVGEPARRYGADGYGQSIYLTDPDGNTLELKGPPEPAA
ncbi:MAG: VOC family protein [Alphaproteobacteria bacterium]|nr:VOC family protein [Alphaproteobacteria bacterium]